MSPGDSGRTLGNWTPGQCQGSRLARGAAEREDLSPVEIVAAGKKIAELLPAPNKGGRPKKGKETSGNFPEVSRVQSRDKIGSALGVSGRTFAKIQEAAAIVAANPERDADLAATSGGT